MIELCDKADKAANEHLVTIKIRTSRNVRTTEGALCASDSGTANLPIRVVDWSTTEPEEFFLEFAPFF